jgi:hypothetical protein
MTKLENRITHCRAGHEFTVQNTLWSKANTRRCRICTRKYARDWRRQHQALGGRSYDKLIAQRESSGWYYRRAIGERMTTENINPIRSAAAKRGARGGKARAAKLTPHERTAIARKAARARWTRRDTSSEK